SCFQGVKMIPPGLHLLHYCSSNAPDCGGETGSKTVCLPNFLGEPGAGHKVAASLGLYVCRQQPNPITLAQTPRTVRNRTCLGTIKCQTMKEGLDRLHRMKRDGTELRFSPIPRQTYPPGATPAQITQCSPDLSYSGKKNTVAAFPRSGRPAKVTAKLQFAFGFEHGKRLLALLCRSESPDLYLGLIAVLYQQLGEIPPDFSVDIVSQDNYLTSTLQVILSHPCNSHTDSGEAKVKSHASSETQPCQAALLLDTLLA
uniref:Protein AAR2 homolog n=1 Tax=Salmo trutta TaxID=8032 RepID=A0A674CNM9_SALTR